jgi:hypothetical protein
MYYDNLILSKKGDIIMSNKSKTFKAVVILLNIVLIVCVLGILGLFVVAILQAFGTDLVIHYDQVNNMFGMQQGFVEQLPRLQKVYSTLLVLLLAVPTFIMLYILRSIFADMSKGVRFELSHVKKIRWIAILIAFQGVVEMCLPLLNSIILNAHSFKITIFNEKYLWALIVMALAEIFAYGVDLQTDSDMTV